MRRPIDEVLGRIVAATIVICACAALMALTIYFIHWLAQGGD